ncbi:MAG: hypothetical protein QGG40_20735, partial [Myxococcota bacterium]|nr:hypothetical protein [Myxococcota bacterium]
WDADEDGVPGVTVLLDVPLFDDVRVYMVQTGHTLLQGQVRGPDEVHGAIEVTTLEQRTIGASNVLFTPNPRIEPNNARSTFSLVRVEEGTTCSDLVTVNEDE